ncbi:MAG TPA: hypothetical protein DCL73_17210 [Treponema sp.]|nr:hypothetical protein [Treponema sp.]
MLQNEKDESFVPQDQRKAIFISHSSRDENIASKLVDALIEMGIDKDILFYSSRPETGIEVGNQLEKKLYENLRSSEVVIFVLTDNFYRSPICMNEMGAAWILNKEVVPILLGGLTPDGMQGVIDKKYIAFSTEKDDVTRLEKKLLKYITKRNTFKTTQEIFSAFLNGANEMIDGDNKAKQDNISEIEKNIVANRFTDDEIILFNLFIELNNNRIEDGCYNYGPNGPYPKKDEEKQKSYISQYIDFDIDKSKQMLMESSIIDELYDSSEVGKSSSEPEYIGYEIKIELFRDLINLTDAAKKKIEAILLKHKNSTGFQNINKFDEVILSDKATEFELLLYKYMIDRTLTTLGDRWMASKQIADIQQWERDNELNNELSVHYDSALRRIIYNKLVTVKNCTSYGNPREYELCAGYAEMLFNINGASEKKLNKILEKNKDATEIPF